MNTRRQLIYSAFAFGFIALLFGMWFRYNTILPKKSNAIELKNGSVLPQPRDIAPFYLTDSFKKPLTNEALKGHWSLLFFGFTHCPELCPTTLSTVNTTFQKLAAQHLPSIPHMIFVSVDPERDSLKHIQDYVTSFNKNFMGATGSKEELDKLTQNLSILYTKVNPQGDDNNYQIDHSGTILMIDPQGRLYALFSPPHDPDNLAHDISSIESTYKERS